MFSTTGRSRPQPHGDPDPQTGIGTARLLLYVAAFVALMMVGSGTVLTVQSLLDVLAADRSLGSSAPTLAWGLAIIIVGAPIWALTWRFVQRGVAAAPAEQRSIVRKLYLYAALAVALASAAGGLFELIEWLFRVDDFSGFPWAALATWSVVWAYHWRIASRDDHGAVGTRGLRRFYLYAAAFVGLWMLTVGAAAVAFVLIDAAYGALFSDGLRSDGLWSYSTRSAVATAIVGGTIWSAHWFRFAWTDRGSVLRWIYLFLPTVGGLVIGLAGVGLLVYVVAAWALGAADSAAVAHFEMAPPALAAAAVGSALWAYFRRRMLHEAVGDDAAPVRRAYGHLAASAGLLALAAASFVVFNTAVRIVANAAAEAPGGGDVWRVPVSGAIAFLVVGALAWAYHWRRLQLAAARDPVPERTAVSRRVYLMGVLGVGLLAFVTGASGVLFVLLRDLLDAALSANTLDDLSSPLATLLTAALLVPYHWSAYRADRATEPEAPEPGAETARKRVTMLVAPGGESLVKAVEDAIGYPVEAVRWTDEAAYAPQLDDDAPARVAREISAAPGPNVLLIPDGSALRVVSFE